MWVAFGLGGRGGRIWACGLKFILLVSFSDTLLVVSILDMGWGLWPVSRVGSSAPAPRFPRSMVWESFSDTLLVVSILDIVYDYH